MAIRADRIPGLRDRVIGSTRLRILGLVMQNPGISYRELCDDTGTVLFNIGGHLAALRKMGLVHWEPEKKRTLVATCRFEVVDDMSDLDATQSSA